MVNAKTLVRSVAAAVVLIVVSASVAIAQPQSQQVSPSDTVRSFYKLMREKKFREAFALSIYGPAIDPLSPTEFEDLRVDFDRMAGAIPEQVNITGEQISGDVWTK